MGSSCQRDFTEKSVHSEMASTEQKPYNAQEVEDLRFEGGSDHFTTNRHQLHNNEAKTFNMMHFRSEDDAPFIRPKIPERPYFSATIPAGEGYGGQGCEKVP